MSPAPNTQFSFTTNADSSPSQGSNHFSALPPILSHFDSTLNSRSNFMDDEEQSFSPPPQQAPHSVPTTQSQPAPATGPVAAHKLDLLAKEYDVDAVGRSQMDTFCKLGASLPLPDLMTRLVSFTAQVSTLAEIKRLKRVITHNHQGPGGMKAFMDEIKIHLNAHFQFDKAQEVNIQTLVKQKIGSHTRVNFTTAIFTDTMVEKGRYRMANVFGFPDREGMLKSRVSKACSSIKGSLKADIYASIQKKEPLDQFTIRMNNKLTPEMPATASGLERTFLVRYAILRRIAYDNSDLLSGNDDSDDASIEPPKKKHKGRVSTKLTYWGKVDEFFRQEIPTRGKVLNGSKWKDFIDPLIRFDEAGFKEPSQEDPMDERALDLTSNTSGFQAGGMIEGDERAQASTQGMGLMGLLN